MLGSIQRTLPTKTDPILQASLTLFYPVGPQKFYGPFRRLSNVHENPAHLTHADSESAIRFVLRCWEVSNAPSPPPRKLLYGRRTVYLLA